MYEIGHLALSSPDGPWSCIAHYIRNDLTLYLIDMRTGDLAYLIENNPDIVFTVAESDAREKGWPHVTVQLFGKAYELTADELSQSPNTVRAAYTEQAQRQPDVYGVIVVMPERVYLIKRNNESHLQETLDIKPEEAYR
jgi:nitroimidazol reductase NimA-like FMN-containing flavoprotein (pyridoxamine 5'-phosphate oxidase superfamily)